MAHPDCSHAASRYELIEFIASGGMATVFLGRLRGPVGFTRLVAIKRAHVELTRDETFRRMIVTEARIASKLHHPNVVAIDDIEELGDELRLVMDYVEGAPLSDLTLAAKLGQRLPARVVVRIILDACAGLHAAHTLTDDCGDALSLVHRDVTPHNILVGLDGTSRLADFGIAKTLRSTLATIAGGVKGKVGYMAPEYVQGAEPDARSDVFGLAVVLWEALTATKLFRADNDVETLRRIITQPAPRVTSRAPWLPHTFDDVLGPALEKSPGDRFQSARAFGAALEVAARWADLVATHAEVSSEVERHFGEALRRRRRVVRERPVCDAPSRSETPTALPPTDDDPSSIGGLPPRSSAVLIIAAGLLLGALLLCGVQLVRFRRAADDSSTRPAPPATASANAGEEARVEASATSALLTLQPSQDSAAAPRAPKTSPRASSGLPRRSKALPANPYSDAVPP
jgi:serine/threonine-protein kinase